MYAYINGSKYEGKKRIPKALAWLFRFWSCCCCVSLLTALRTINNICRSTTRTTKCFSLETKRCNAIVPFHILLYLSLKYEIKHNYSIVFHPAVCWFSRIKRECVRVCVSLCVCEREFFCRAFELITKLLYICV